MGNQDLQLNVLGPFELLWKGEPVTRLRMDKVRALFAFLCLESTRTHRRERLAGLFWSEMETKDGKHNLRQSIYTIKKALDSLESNLGKQLLSTSRQEIQVDSEHICLDALSLVEGIEKANWNANDKPTVEELEELEALARCYRGPLLDGFSLGDEPLFDEWLLARREYFHKSAVGLFAKLSLLYLEEQAFQRADTWLTRWLECEPWSEEAHRGKMRHLVYTGQRSAALAQYHHLEKILLDEFQADPADETIELYERIHCELVEAPGLPLEQNTLHHFPVTNTTFIGRGVDLAQLQDLILQEDIRLLTVQGIGGIGKTRLLIQFAKVLSESSHPFRDGIFFVPLASVDGAERVPSLMAQCLGLMIKNSVGEEKQLIDFLRGKQLLLVLDNVEHVLASKAFLQKILETAEGVKILLSSRVALKIGAEHRYLLGGLKSSDAQELFVESARRVNNGFALSEYAEEIKQICSLVDGSPLAVGLAASWVRLMDCKTILDEIQEDVHFLESDWEDLPKRHRSMAKVFESTWAKLNEDEHRLLAQVSIFQGSFSLSFIRRMLKLPVRTIVQLVDKAVLLQTTNGRFALHSLFKQYVSHKRSGMEGSDAFETTFYRTFLAWIVERESAFTNSGIVGAIKDLQEDWDNVVHAWQLAVKAGAFELLKEASRGFSYFVKFSGLSREGVKLFAGAAASAKAHESRREEQLIFLVSQLECTIDKEDFQKAEFEIEDLEKLGLLEDKGSYYFHYVTFLQARMRMELGHYAEATDLFDKTLHHFDERGEATICSKIRGFLGKIYTFQGRYEEAVKILDAGLAYDRATDFTSEIAYKLNVLGIAQSRLGEVQYAKECLKKSCELAEQLELKVEMGSYLNNLGNIFLRMGAIDDAMLHYEKGHKVFSGLGLFKLASNCLSNVGVIHASQGRYQEAEKIFLEVITTRKLIGHVSRIDTSLGNLAGICFLMGNVSKAREYFLRALQEAKKLNHQDLIGLYLGSIGRICIIQREFETAEDHFQQGIDLLRKIKCKDTLCWILLEQGEGRFVQKRFNEAIQSIDESFEIACSLELKEHIARGAAFRARLSKELGEVEEGIAHLESVQSKFHLAFPAKTWIDEAMWWIRGSQEDYDAAMTALQATYEKEPSAENKERLERLQLSKVKLDE